MPPFAKSSKCSHYSLPLAIAVMFTVSSSSLQAKPQSRKDAEIHEHDVHLVHKLIENCPKWYGIFPGDPQTKFKKQKIFKTLDQIAAYDDDTIEAAVEAYKLPHYRYNGERFTISLVTRYLYDVPEKLPMKALPIQGDFLYIGGPRDRININAMWPLFYRSDGRLDTYTNLMGPADYPVGGESMVAGFEYCRRHFTRRSQRRHI